jgi:hypothetical protein
MEWHALIPSLIGGSLVAILWLMETRQSEFDWACSVDRRLGLNGRLLAALTAERGGFVSPMGKQLIEGLRPRVSRQAILRRAVPVSLWLLVLPFIGGALLLQVLQDQRGQVVRWERSAPQFRDLQGQLGEAQRRAQSLGAGGALLEELQAMQDAARRGGIEMELGKGDAAEWRAELKELAADLAQATEPLRGDGEWDRAMDRAQGLVTALQDRMGEAPSDDASAPAAQGETRPVVTLGSSAGTPSPGAEPNPGWGAASNLGGGGDSAGGAGGEAQGLEAAGVPETPIADPAWTLQDSPLQTLPQVPRPYRSLVQRFLAPE